MLIMLFVFLLPLMLVIKEYYLSENKCGFICNKHPVRVISPHRAKFGVAPRGAGVEIQIPVPRSFKFVHIPIEYTCNVSSTSF